MHAGVIGPDAIAGMTAASVDEKVTIVREAAGQRMAEIEMNVRAFLVNVTSDGATARAGMAQMFGVETSMIDETPFALIGPPDELVDLLVERRERWGFSYVIVGGEDVDAFAPVVARLAGT